MGADELQERFEKVGPSCDRHVAGAALCRSIGDFGDFGTLYLAT